MSETTFERGRRHLRQFIKFGIVGGSGVLVNLLVTFVMTKLHGGTVHDNDPLFWLTSKFAFRFTILVWIVAFVVANTYNFQLNRSWTFKREHRRSWWAEFWPFFLVGSIAAAIGGLIKWALTNPTSVFYLPSPTFNDHQGLRARAYWSQLIAIVLTLPINFVVNKLWTFRAVHHHQADRQHADQHQPTAYDLPMVAPVMDPSDVEDTGELRADEIARAGRPDGDTARG